METQSFIGESPGSLKSTLTPFISEMTYVHFRTFDKHKLFLAFVMADFNPLPGLTWAVINIEAGHRTTV